MCEKLDDGKGTFLFLLSQNFFHSIILIQGWPGKAGQGRAGGES